MNKFFIRKEAGDSETYNYQNPEDRKRFINRRTTNPVLGGAYGAALGGTAGIAANSLRVGGVGAGLGALAGLGITALANKMRRKSNESKWNELTDNGRKRGKVTVTTDYY